MILSIFMLQVWGSATSFLSVFCYLSLPVIIFGFPALNSKVTIHFIVNIVNRTHWKKFLWFKKLIATCLRLAPQIHMQLRGLECITESSYSSSVASILIIRWFDSSIEVQKYRDTGFTASQTSKLPIWEFFKKCVTRFIISHTF